MTLVAGVGGYIIDPALPVVPQYMDYALSQLVEEYASRGITLPGRRYWTIGEEAVDCEQAVLTVRGMVLGSPGDSEPPVITRCNALKSLTFGLQIMRCVPVADTRGRAPEALAIQESAVPVVVDMEIMMFELPARFDAYNVGIAATVDAVGAEGGLHGAVGTYTVTV